MNTGWTAIYADGRVQKQYPSSGAENTFASVQKEMPKIFMVGDKHGVNLETGAFMIGGKWVQVGDKEGVWRKPLNLIYFRRNQVDWQTSERVKRIGLFGVALSITLPPPKPKKVKCDSYFGYEYSTGQILYCLPRNGKNPTICV